MNVDISRAQELVHLTCDWTMALGNRTEFSSTLSRLRDLTHADHAAVFRKCRITQRCQCISDQNTCRGKAQPQSRADRMLSDTVLGDDLFVLRKGAIHLMTDALGWSSSKMSERTGYSEILICILAGTNSNIDLFELKYRATPAECDLDLLRIQAPTLASVWDRRNTGTVRAMMQPKELRVINGGLSDTETCKEDILGVDNPMHLTRAEFRICSLMQEGKMPNDLLAELKISRNTFRTHMRSIYLKTGAKGQVELVHMLHRKLSA